MEQDMRSSCNALWIVNNRIQMNNDTPTSLSSEILLHFAICTGWYLITKWSKILTCDAQAVLSTTEFKWTTIRQRRCRQRSYFTCDTYWMVPYHRMEQDIDLRCVVNRREPNSKIRQNADVAYCQWSYLTSWYVLDGTLSRSGARCWLAMRCGLLWRTKLQVAILWNNNNVLMTAAALKMLPFARAMFESSRQKRKKLRVALNVAICTHNFWVVPPKKENRHTTKPLRNIKFTSSAQKFKATFKDALTIGSSLAGVWYPCNYHLSRCPVSTKCTKRATGDRISRMWRTIDKPSSYSVSIAFVFCICIMCTIVNLSFIREHPHQSSPIITMSWHSKTMLHETWKCL